MIDVRHHAEAGASQARLRIFAGPNGSGKSTIQELLRPEWIGIYVNADDIEKALATEGSLDLSKYAFNAPFGELTKRLANHLESSVFLRDKGLGGVATCLNIDKALNLSLFGAPTNSYVAAVLADGIRQELLGQKSTFTFETVMSSTDKIAFMQKAKALGYRTYLYFVATEDPAINIERVRLRVSQGGHGVPDEKVRSRYARSISLLDDAADVADRTYIFDNSGSSHQCIAEINKLDGLKVFTECLPFWFTGSSLWKSFNSNAAGS